MKIYKQTYARIIQKKKSPLRSSEWSGFHFRAICEVWFSICKHLILLYKKNYRIHAYEELKIYSRWDLGHMEIFTQWQFKQLFVIAILLFFTVFDVVYFCLWISYFQYLIIFIPILSFVFLYSLDNLTTRISK